MINYTIQAGDTLAGIARKFLGNALRYREIATMNNIVNPNVITIGQVIRIPATVLTQGGRTTIRADDARTPGIVGPPAPRVPVPGDPDYIFPLKEISGSAKRDYLPAMIAAAILLYAFSDKRF